MDKKILDPYFEIKLKSERSSLEEPLETESLLKFSL